MKWIVPVLFLAAAALACCPSPAPAGSCGVVTRAVVTTNYATYTPPVVAVVKNVVVKEVVATVVPVAVYQPVALLVPSYAASYVPAPPPAPAPAVAAPGPSAESRAILDALNRLNSRMDALERGGGAPPPVRLAAPPPPPMPPAALAAPPASGIRAGAVGTPAVFTNKCSQCHTKGRLDPNTDFVLLDEAGVVVPLDLRAREAMRKRLYNGTMPPKNNKLGIQPCNDEDVAEGMAYMDAQPAK